MAAVSAEIDFARKLASNELEVRQKSEELLKKWLRKKAKKGMKEMEMSVLWKGLFASMFMSDKPLIQEKLASDLSKLVHLFPKCSVGVKFCRVFFDTIAREWHGIDRLRLDKYYTLIRCFMNESFAYLQAQGWPERSVKGFMTAVTAHNEKCPGLVLHIVDVFLPELQNAATSKISFTTTVLLLKPWFEVVTKTRDKIMAKLIEENIFDKILKGHKVKYLTIEWAEFASVVWDLVASDQDILTRNRKILHQIHTRLMDRSTQSSHAST